MDNVWIVESEWIYDGYPFEDYEHKILGVFKTEEAAVNYILERLADMLRCKKEATKYDYRCADLCFTELPTKEDLMSTKDFKFSDFSDTQERLKYFEAPVQD